MFTCVAGIAYFSHGATGGKQPHKMCYRLSSQMIGVSNVLIKNIVTNLRE